MAHSLKELSASLREAIQRGAAVTVGIEHDPYPVSGVLVGGDRILTANHLIGDGDTEVHLPEGRTAIAKTVARDEPHDLALLQLADGTRAPAPTVSSVAVGDLVLSLRRDPFDGINASLGMVGASGARLRVGRAGVVERYFQVDRDRLSGTTGGPVVDSEGGLAGINVFNRRMGAELVLPADFALARAKLLEERGSVKRPHLGVRCQAVPLAGPAREAVKGRQDGGLLIVMVERGSAAEAAGMTVGDIVVGFRGVLVADNESLVAAIAETGAGAVVDIDVLRGGVLRTLKATVGGA
jgi:serine protease Do